MYFIDHLRFWLGPNASSSGLGVASLTEDEEKRVDHYIKLAEPFSLSGASPVNSVSRFTKTGYAYDWYRIFKRTDSRLCHKIFGDVSYLTDQPTFCKSRPLFDDNSNNVILPLNTVRHFQFFNDPLPLQKKKDKAVWRGAAYKPNRKEFLRVTASLPRCDTEDTSRDSPRSVLGRSINFMPISEQLKYKFIFAIEGNDVATNLKWAMATNSAVIMPRPTRETWFCEHQLVANQHFIEIRQDYTDLEEKLDYYLTYPSKTLEIIREANAYSAIFRDLPRQFMIARVVAERYFSLVR